MKEKIKNVIAWTFVIGYPIAGLVFYYALLTFLCMYPKGIIPLIISASFLVTITVLTLKLTKEPPKTRRKKKHSNA